MTVKNLFDVVVPAQVVSNPTSQYSYIVDNTGKNWFSAAPGDTNYPIVVQNSAAQNVMDIYKDRMIECLSVWLQSSGTTNMCMTCR